ncbi:MAG: metal-dependent transcriptional regulator [Desulfatiglandales bacterium]
MSRSENLSASLEDYLEAIFHIAAEKQAAKAKDIAQRLKLKSSSVTGALHLLSEKGLINYAPYDLITLTPEGKKAAEEVVHRHNTLRNFFMNVLLVDETEAELSACKMEHAISRTILDRLVQFMKFIELCPRVEKNWVTTFERCKDTGQLQEICKRCTAFSLKEAHEENQP